MANSQAKKVSVVGAGAIGTLIGGLIKFHRPDVEVMLITRGAHLERMHQTGNAVLQGPWGSRTVAVTASNDCQAIADSDLILFAVKSQSTIETAEQMQPSLGNAVVVSLQNGINQHLLGRFVRPDRLLMGMTATNMALVSSGVVSLQRDGLSVIGSPTGEVPPAVSEEARSTLALSGLRFETTDNILGVQYNKLLMNSMGYASVISDADFITDGILYRPWRTHVALPLLDEGLSVLAAAGIALERTSGISDVLRFQRLLKALNTPPVDSSARWMLKNIFRPKKIVYSVSQDLARGKPTEIDFVNGEIVRLAKQSGVEAPRNELVVRMIRELERTKSKTFPGHDQVISRFRQLVGDGGEPGRGSVA